MNIFIYPYIRILKYKRCVNVLYSHLKIRLIKNIYPLEIIKEVPK